MFTVGEHRPNGVRAVDTTFKHSAYLIHGRERFSFIQELTRPQNATAVFEGWEDTIVLSCLSGMMGHIYGDDLVNPSAALAVLGDFCFFTGRPSPELIDFAAGLFCRGGILVPQNELGHKLARIGSSEQFI